MHIVIPHKSASLIAKLESPDADSAVFIILRSTGRERCVIRACITVCRPCDEAIVGAC